MHRINLETDSKLRLTIIVCLTSSTRFSSDCCHFKFTDPRHETMQKLGRHSWLKQVPPSSPPFFPHPPTSTPLPPLRGGRPSAVIEMYRQFSWRASFFRHIICCSSFCLSSTPSHPMIECFTPDQNVLAGNLFERIGVLWRSALNYQ